MKIALVALSLITLPALAVALGMQGPISEEAGGEPSAALMRSKLDNSKRILEGLTTEDFQAIRKSAKAMRDLTILEHWRNASAPQYKKQLNVFWLATDGLIQAADDKNLDGATLAYTQMTVSCVNCHRSIRGVVRAK